jgi:hypothetical protein
MMDAVRVVQCNRPRGQSAWWAIVLVACSFDATGNAGPVETLGNGEPSGSGPTLSTSTSTTGTISEATEGATEGGETAGSTNGGDSTDEGETSDDTGMPLELDDEDLLVRYYLDEPAAMPTSARDAANEPLDLTITWSSALSYVDIDGNRGLYWDAPGEPGGPAHALAENNKVRARIDGQTAATIEFVADVHDAGDDSRIVSIEHGGSDIKLGVIAHGSDTLELRWRNNRKAASWEIDLPSLERAVFHVVFDSEADFDDRVRLYVDGELQAASEPSGDWPNDAEDITFHNDSQLTLGNRISSQGDRSFEGVLYYAALYATAFEQSRVLEHAAVLEKDDDTPKN